MTKILKILGYCASALAAYALIRTGLTYLHANEISEAVLQEFEAVAAKLVDGSRITESHYDRSARQFVIHVDVDKASGWIPNDFMSRVEACRYQSTSEIRKLANYKATWKHIYLNRTTGQTFERRLSPEDCLEIQDSFFRRTFSSRDLQDLERYVASEAGQRTLNVNDNPQMDSWVSKSQFNKTTQAYLAEMVFTRKDLDARRGDTHTTSPEAITHTLNALCQASMFKEIVELGGTFQIDYVVTDSQQRPLSQFTVQSKHCPKAVRL